MSLAIPSLPLPLISYLFVFRLIYFFLSHRSFSFSMKSQCLWLVTKSVVFTFGDRFFLHCIRFSSSTTENYNSNELEKRKYSDEKAASRCFLIVQCIDSSKCFRFFIQKLFIWFENRYEITKSKTAF